MERDAMIEVDATDEGRSRDGTPASGPGTGDVAHPGGERARWSPRRRLVAVIALVAVVAAMVFGVTRLTAAPLSEDVPGPAEGWETAWATGDAEVLRAWFAANTGPTRDVAEEVRGGAIRDQEDADRLVGTTVTSDLDVDCDCVLEEFVLDGAELWVNGGDVVIRNARLDGADDPDLVGVLTARSGAEVRLSRVEITGHHDGVRAYAESVTGDHVFIHDRAESNPEDHHQDGIQVIGGVAVFERSFIDMIGANTSAVLVKPDSRPIPLARINQSVLMGGSYTFHVHDGPEGTPEDVDLSDNLVAPGYGTGLVSTWELTDPDEVISPTYATVSGTGERVELVDGARIPGVEGIDD